MFNFNMLLIRKEHEHDMKIGIVGITGRIGRILSKIIPDNELVGGIRSTTTSVEYERIIQNSDVMIDFSTPSASLKAIEYASKYKVPFVTGTTGFTEAEKEKIKEYSKTIPIIHAENFSVCVQLMAILVKKCADILTEFDFSIIDKHHNKKKDAPSGTALFLARQSHKTAQIVSIRAGNICGEHICDFSGENEMLSIAHRAFNRDIFANGALSCARWIIGKKAKLYTMSDYLEEKMNG